MKYSGKSFDARRLPACYGALQATYPNAKIEIHKTGYPRLKKDPLEILRDKWTYGEKIEFSITLSEDTVLIELREVWDLFYVNVEASNDSLKTQIHELICGTLGLTEASDDERDSEANLYSINQRIVAMGKVIRLLPEQLKATEQIKKPRCFVSFRFDEHSKALALELRNFLELAGLEFSSGLGYEPRSVSEKVLERMTGEIDLFIVIFSVGGDSTWLHQEIGVAKGRGLPIMVLKEGSAKFDEGLLSDIEYAPFPNGQISGAFIPILQAIQYIRLKNIAS